jgi:hypothetical protein
MAKKNEPKPKPGDGGAGFSIFGFRLDKTTAYVMGAAIALYFLWLGWVVLTTKPPEFTDYSVEEPLARNANFSLLPGEKYTYATVINNSEAMALAYDIAQGNGCTIIRSGNASVCVLADGTEAGSARNSSLGYEDKAFSLFKPWMLAVGDGWQWSANVTVEIKEVGYSDTLRVRMKTGAKGTWLGREAYRVDTTIYDENEKVEMNVTDWVDAEKRVLLEEDVGDLKLVLVEAPFALGNSTAQ